MLSIEIDSRAIEEYDKYLKLLGRKGMGFIIQETYTKIAVNARRLQEKEILRRYENPTQATVKGVLFKPAQKKGVDRIESSVFLKDFVADYLGPTIVGAGYSIEDERYGKDVILVPVVSVLKSSKVPASFNQFGNIRALRNASIIKRLLKRKDVFVILIGSNDPTHEPGIYYRPKKGPPVPMFLYVDRVIAKEVYDFFRISEKAADRIDDYFFEALSEHVDKNCKLPST